MQQLEQMVRDRKVVFVTTKNIDYIRNVQEIRFLEQHAGRLRVICSHQKNYAVRILEVWWKLLFAGRGFDVIFFGFAPQLVAPFFTNTETGRSSSIFLSPCTIHSLTTERNSPCTARLPGYATGSTAM